MPNNCSNCANWNTEHASFKIYGNSYYVGVDGLSSVLITSNEGHILIDGGIAALQRMSGVQIAASSESSQALKLGSSLSNDPEACRKYAEDA